MRVKYMIMLVVRLMNAAARASELRAQVSEPSAQVSELDLRIRNQCFARALRITI